MTNLQCSASNHTKVHHDYLLVNKTCKYYFHYAEVNGWFDLHWSQYISPIYQYKQHAILWILLQSTELVDN